jgi:dTDP-4-amino-4,6-dideoxygalactose transaminase
VLDAAGARVASSHYCLIATVVGASADRRNAMVARLNACGVGTSIYYPQPVPRMTYYRAKYGYDPARFPGAESISDASIALPVGPHITADDVAYIASAVSDVLAAAR